MKDIDSRKVIWVVVGIEIFVLGALIYVIAIA